MRIPKNLPQNDHDVEDELRCANLNVTCPSECENGKLPVFLWIYGKSNTRSSTIRANSLTRWLPDGVFRISRPKTGRQVYAPTYKSE